MSAPKTKPLGKAELREAGDLANPELGATLSVYRRSVAGRYRAIQSANMLTELPDTTLLVSPKVDGQLWYLIAESNDVWLASPTGRSIRGPLPIIDEARKTLGARAKDRVVVAGELFALATTGRPRCGDIAARLAEGADADTKRLGFLAFDLVQGGDAECPHPSDDYPERYATLERLLAGGKRVRAIESVSCSGPDEVRAKFVEWVESGKAEGLVARDPVGRIYKIKPRLSLDCAIVGYTERSNAPDQVRSILCAVMRHDGSYQLIGATGNVGSDADRASLHKLLSPTLAASNFRFASDAGAMYRFVRPETVVELTATDAQSEDARGQPLRQHVLLYDDEKGWQPRLPLPGASLLHSSMQRLRDDKSVNDIDIRASQLEERCHVHGLNESAEAVDLPTSEVIRREAYSKASKGKTAVRKVVVWKTNKEAIDATFPAFVVQLTDYSPTRKEPLKRQVRLAPDKATADGIANDIVAANIKKGWSRHGDA